MPGRRPVRRLDRSRPNQTRQSGLKRGAPLQLRTGHGINQARRMERNETSKTVPYILGLRALPLRIRMVPGVGVEPTRL